MDVASGKKTQRSRLDRGFQSLQEHIDITSPGGKFVFHIFGALAEFERNLNASQ